MSLCFLLKMLYISAGSYWCLAMLEDRLTVIHLKFRPYPHAPPDYSAASGYNSDASSIQSPNRSPPMPRNIERTVSLNKLAPMNKPRCSAGVASIGGNLIAVGKLNKIIKTFVGGCCGIVCECYRGL